MTSRRWVEPKLSELFHELEKIDLSCINPPSALNENLSEMLNRNLKELANFTEILTLFNSTLTELKSDGELNLGYLEEGSVLYLFLRKCFLAFAGMDF